MRDAPSAHAALQTELSLALADNELLSKQVKDLLEELSVVREAGADSKRNSKKQSKSLAAAQR